MTVEQAEAEIRYIFARSIYKGLYEEGVISQEQLKQALEDTVREYKPMCGELEVNSIAEEGHTYRSDEESHTKD